MSQLFHIEPRFPPGFDYHPDFLTEAEEAELLTAVSAIELHTFTFQGFEAKRRVASFGFDYHFDKRGLTKGKDIPIVFDPLLKRVGDKLSMNPDQFAELLVTEYPTGSMINWHRDAPPFGVIAGISLNAECVFRLRPHDKQKQGRGSVISFPLKRRSLYIIHGEARANWQHSIAPVKDVRYSITLRTLKA